MEGKIEIGKRHTERDLNKMIEITHVTIASRWRREMRRSGGWAPFWTKRDSFNE
jgi:hypothetical protein